MNKKKIKRLRTGVLVSVLVLLIGVALATDYLNVVFDPCYPDEQYESLKYYEAHPDNMTEFAATSEWKYGHSGEMVLDSWDWTSTGGDIYETAAADTATRSHRKLKFNDVGYYDVTAKVTLESTAYGEDIYEDFTVFDTQLNLDGVADGEEESSPPDTFGAFIANNNDDDDRDGTVDYEDDDNAAEDDLVEIVDFSCEPDDLEGYLRLTTTGDLKVWSSAQKESLVVGKNSYTTWQIGSASEPTELWLEGSGGGGTLTLKYSPDGDEFPGTLNADVIDVKAVTVDVDVDDDYDNYWDPEENSLWREESVGAIVGKHADNMAGYAPEDVPIIVGPPLGVPYTEDWSVTLRTETGARGSGGVIEIYDYTDPYNPVNLGSSVTFDNDANPIPAEGILKVRGETASIQPRDVSLILEYDVQGRTIHDKIHFTVVKLGLEDDLNPYSPAVPEYLFASATYATPIRFKVGLRDGADFTPMWIHQIQADLVLGYVYEKTFLINNRFVNNSGATQDNGSAEIYTGYIKASDYSTINLGDAHGIGGDYTYFDVWVECSLIEDGPKCWVGCYEHPNGKMTFFADDYLFTVESRVPGTTGTGDYTGVDISSGSQAHVDMEGHKLFRHWQQGGIGLYCHPAHGYSYDPGHDECIEMEELPGRIGVNYCWKLFEGDAYSQDSTATATGLRLFTRLYDSQDWIDDPVHPLGPDNVGMKNRIFARRRGGYFYVSYGGKQLASGILESGEYAMDLTKTGGSMTCNMFDTGTAEIETVVEGTDGLGLVKNGLAAFGVVCGIANFSQAWAILTAAAIVADVLDGSDKEGIDSKNKGEGCVYTYSVLYHADSPSTPHPEREGYWNEEGAFGLPIEENSKAWTAGCQWVFFVDLNSAVSAETRMLDSIEVSAEVTYECGNTADFTTMDITVRD